MMDKRVEVRATSFPWDGKLSLKEDESKLANCMCGKETGILPYYYFSIKRLDFYITKEEDKSTP